jgi:Rho-binding antiterminator
MTSTPIACELHDYIEIACTFRYPVLLTLESGEKLNGIATNILIKQGKGECLILREDISKETIEIPLNNLVQMQSLIKNPHFGKVDFHPQ